MTVIAVTGAGGFIGRHFCREMGASARIVPLVRAGASSRGGAVVDFDSQAALVGALRGADAVLHLAARAHVVNEKWNAAADEAHRAVNVDLTRRLGVAAVNAGVRRFVFVSSAGVLGRTSPPGGFDEEAQPSPHDAYTRSKLEAEQWLTEHSTGKIELVVVRPPLVYGPDARGNFERILRAAAMGRPLPVGSLRAPRSMVGVRNLSHFLMVCIEHPNAPGLPLLVAEPETTTLADLAEEVAGLAGVRGRSFSVPPRLLATGLRLLGRGADAARLVSPFEIRVARARTLGWRPAFERSLEMAWTVRTFLQSSR